VIAVMLEDGNIFIFGPLKWGSTFMPEAAGILGPTCRRRITLASRLADRP
jgi:hypothetical protein